MSDSVVHIDTTKPNIEQTVVFQAVCELRCTIVVIKLVSDSHCIAIDINQGVQIAVVQDVNNS